MYMWNISHDYVKLSIWCTRSDCWLNLHGITDSVNPSQSGDLLFCWIMVRQYTQNRISSSVSNWMTLNSNSFILQPDLCLFRYLIWDSHHPTLPCTLPSTAWKVETRHRSPKQMWSGGESVKATLCPGWNVFPRGRFVIGGIITVLAHLPFCTFRRPRFVAATRGGVGQSVS